MGPRISELPQDAASLRDDLSAFYQTTRDYMLKAEAVFAFAKERALIWEDRLNTPYAMKRVTDSMTPAEVVALLDEDIAAIAGSVSQFKSLSCPEECKNMLDGTAAMLERNFRNEER